MPTFREFLKQKSTELGQPERRQRREEWVSAVGRLREQIRAWLAESDPDGVLAILPYEDDCIEPSLGVYRVPMLRITLGNEGVDVVPVARNSLGIVELRNGEEVRPQGSVDVTDGVVKIHLHRTLQDGQERWLVEGEDYKADPLSKEKLEQILLGFLS